MALHRNLTATDGIHIIQAWEYPDAATRLGATGFVAADVGKVARQADTQTFWVLTSHAPVTWLGLGGDVVTWDNVAAALGGQAGANAGYVFKSDGEGSGDMVPDDQEVDHFLTVGKSGDVNYNTIKEAVDYATAQGGVWEIKVYPGTYSEAPMSVGPGIVIRSSDNRIDTVFVVASNASEDLFTCTGGYFGGISVSGVSDSGKCLWRCATAYSLVVLHGVSFKNCSNGVICSGGASVICTNNSINLTGAGQGVTTGYTVTGSGSYMGHNGGFFSVPAAILPAYASNPVQTVFRVADSARFTIAGATANVAYKTTDADVLLADGGSYSTILACEVRNAGTGAHIGSSGTGTKVIAQAGVWQGNYLNGKCDSSTGVFMVASASGSLGFSAVAGTILSGLIQVISDGYTYIAGSAGYQYVTQKVVDFQQFFHDQVSTGLSYGGEVTAATGLNVDVAAGEGWVTRHTPYHDSWSVSWDAATDVALTASSTNYVVYDSASETILAQTSPHSTSQVLLSTVYTDGSGIRFLHKTRHYVHDESELLHNYLVDTRRIAWKTGLAVVEGSTAVKFDVSSGSWYVALDLVDITGDTDVTFSYFYGSGAATEVSGQTELDTTYYDNAGTLTAMTAGYFRADTLIVTSDGRFSVIYGTEEFATADLAELTTNRASIPSFMADTGCYVALIVVQQGTGIDSIVDIRPDPNAATSGGGGGGGSGDHSALVNLDKPDDHLWAFLVNGTRAMTGALNMGSNNITNAGTINGVTVTAHAGRHLPGAADALTVGTPVAVEVGATPSAGDSTNFARGNHQHGIVAGTPADIGTSNNAGSGTTVARANHVHAGLNRNAGDFAAFTEKGTAVDTDLVLIEDSEDSGAKKKVQVGNLPGGTGGATALAAVQARKTATLVMPTAWTDVSFDTTDIENNTAVLDHQAGTPDRILVGETGLYLIIYQFEVSPSTSGSFYGRVRKNDTDVVVGSTQSSYTYGGESDIISINVIASLTAGDFLSVQTYIATAGTMAANATFAAYKLNGTQGTPGSGSTITLYDEGTPLTNTPHAGVNFVGGGVTAVDAGGGVATVTIPTSGVFGTQAQDAENPTPASTTSTAFTQFLRITTPVVPAGRYRIGWYYNWRYASTANDFLARVQVDDTTTVMSQQQEPQDAGADQRYPVGGFAYVNLTNAAHTIDLDFASNLAGTAATMNNARLEIWRVS